MRKVNNCSNTEEMNKRVKGKVKNRQIILKLKRVLKVQIRNDSNSTSEMSSESNSYCE